MTSASFSMIEAVCRYIAILALVVRVCLSFYTGRTVRKTANGSGTATQATPRTLRPAMLLFANIWVAIALMFWLTALLQEYLSPDGL